MKQRSLRPLAAITILALTIVAFAYYWQTHPELLARLRTVSPVVFLVILGLYGCMVGCLALINSATLRLCDVRLGKQESTLLAMYTSVVNFFGPLQTGPAVRAVYVKKKHGVSLARYTTATLVYYAFFAALSGLLLVWSIFKFWLVVLVLIGLGVTYVAYVHDSPLIQRFKRLNIGGWYLLLAATALQVAITVAIYYVELRSVVPNVSLGQAVTYAGAANFALFVSLTPGAIGFRESFLVFSQRLHHIDSNAIVLANTIDRAVYIVLLALLVVVITLTHTANRLAITKK